MPIRQNILRKGKAPKQNLLQFDVLQEESGVLGDLTTSNFFKISEFPSVLPSGNSSFLIEGSNLLKPNIELKTELLDADGNPIFHYAIPNYDKELPARRIAIEIYDDEVVNGVGSFTVLGELNPTEFDIQSDFQNTYNVRFTAPISINKKIKNTEPIRFYGDPSLTVSELIKGVIEKVPTGDSTQVTITGSVEFVNPTPQTEFSVDSGSTTGNSNQFDEVGNSVASYVNQNQGSAQSSILPQTTITTKPFTFVVKEMEKGVDNALNKITSGMKGAVFSITRPDNLVDNTLYPDSKFAKPQTFETKILDVINSTTFTTTTEYVITNKSNNNKIVVPLQPSSSQATITHNVVSSTETEDQVFKRSFANMTVGNLRTFSGDTYKAKIYMKEEGTSGEFEKIYETLVESPNELVNKNSISGFENIGIFFTQSLIENNWVSASNNSTTPSASVDDDVIIDGVLLSGSNAGVGDSFTFVTKTNLELEKNEDYIVEFNSAFKKAPKTQSDGTSKQQAELEVFITGSFETESDKEISLGTIDLPDTTNTDFTIIQQKQIADFRTHNASSTPTGSLGFRVNSGEFILSDIRLRPFTQTNFSPGFFKANVPMPKPIKRGKLYDFLVEFYDANNNLAETVAIVDNVSFQGPPQIIADGADGLLTGSLFLGSLTGSGIELHGGSAYMRSIGYNGFNDTISNNLGGFLMFSGSVSESMGTTEDYKGVGLEIVDAHGTTDRFLKFRTNPSEFTVQTDQFFLGKDGQFISGSNGNIVISSSNFFLGGENTFVSGSNDKLEISSSNFHLDNDGSVTMQGNITAEAGGTIGGFTIGASSLAAGNVFQLSSSQNTADPVSFISSSAFKVSAGGIITGSNILLTGGTITSGVTVEGTFSANSILTPATIAGSPTTVTNASSSIDANGNAVFRSGSIGNFNFDGTTLFSDSGEFIVTGSTGQITASAAKIAGSDVSIDVEKFELSTTGLQISSTVPSMSLGTSQEIMMRANNNSPYIALQPSVALADKTYGEVGAFLGVASGNTPKFSLVKDSNNRFLFDGDTLQIDTPKFAVSTAGNITATGGTIGGFTITDTNLETTNFVSGEKGIRLSTAGNGSLEVEEAKIRGTLKTTVFEKESVNAVGGQLIVANATVITGSDVSKTATTMSVENVTGFAADEILLIKKVSGSNFSTEYVQVISSSNDFNSDTNFQGKLMVSRSFGSSATYNPSLHSGSITTTTATGSTYSPGQVLVSTGKVNTGYIKLNANPNDSATPFIDIVERTGSGVFDVDLKARLGDLSGLSSALVGSSPGFGLFSQNVFLTGKVTATSGTIASWDIDGNKIESTNASNKGIILDADPSSPTIEVRESDDNRIRIFHTTNNDFGLIGTQGGNNVFLLGDPGGQGNRIAGWSFDNTTIKNGTDIQLDSSNKKITINDQTFGNTGIQLDHNSGTPRAHIGKSNGEGFKFDGTNVVMSASSFQLGNNVSFVSGSNGNVKISGSSVDIQTPAFLFGDLNKSLISGSNGNVKISGSSVDIQTPAFVLGDLNKAFISGSNGNLELSASNFILGTSASNAAGGATGVGAYVSSSNNNLRISSSGFDFNSIGNIGTLNVADGKLEFDGTDLTIDGTVNIGSTAASTIETKANAAQSATDVNDADKTAGTVGGWSITSNEIKSNSNKIILHQNNGVNGQIKLNAATSETAGDGVYMDGTGAFRAGDADGERIYFDGSNAIISASSFKMGNHANFISGSNGVIEISSSVFKIGSGKESRDGALSTGAFISSSLSSGGLLTISSSNFHLSSSGNLNVGNGNMVVDTDGNVSVEGTITTNASSQLNAGTLAGFSLDADEIKIGSTLILDSNSSSGQIKLNAATSETAGDGVYMDGTGKFRAGDADGERIFFDGTNAIVSASSFKMGNNTSFVSGSNGNVKISGSSVDIQTPAFILGDLDSSFVSGSNGNLSMGAETFTLTATTSSQAGDTGITIQSSDKTIQLSGSNSITDGNSVILDGGDGVIQISQSGEGIFDTGRTAVFTKNTVVEPGVFKVGSLPDKEIVSSSTEITNPVPTAENLQVISSSKMNRLETQQIYMDTNSNTSVMGALTPFLYTDKGTGRYKNTGINSASSVVFSSQKNLTGLTHTDRSLPPEFVFSSEYYTVPIETPGEFGFVNNSENSGSSIFTITTKVSGSNHTSATGDTNDFTDAKFNILALEADTRGLPNARKSEFTFLQAKASSSIMFQLQHDGDVVSRGNLTAFGTSFLTVSDKREKKNIYQISESLDKVLELRPTKFTWKETDKEDVGFIAQEVEEIIPEVVETTKGFIDIDNEKQPEERKTISYPKLVPYLVDTIKELTKRIEELEKKVK